MRFFWGGGKNAFLPRPICHFPIPTMLKVISLGGGKNVFCPPPLDPPVADSQAALNVLAARPELKSGLASLVSYLGFRAHPLNKTASVCLQMLLSR